MERLLRASLAEDVKQIRFSGLHGSARYLQVVITKRNGLHLLPLVVEHVDCGLMKEERVRLKEEVCQQEDGYSKKIYFNVFFMLINFWYKKIVNLLLNLVKLNM